MATRQTSCPCCWAGGAPFGDRCCACNVDYWTKGRRFGQNSPCYLQSRYASEEETFDLTTNEPARDKSFLAAILVSLTESTYLIRSAATQTCERSHLGRLHIYGSVLVCSNCAGFQRRLISIEETEIGNPGLETCAEGFPGRVRYIGRKDSQSIALDGECRRAGHNSASGLKMSISASRWLPLHASRMVGQPCIVRSFNTREALRSVAVSPRASTSRRRRSPRAMDRRRGGNAMPLRSDLLSTGKRHRRMFA